jgi:hypothetical protein
VPGEGWWGLDSILKEAAAEAAYYAGIPPVACPNDGEPLIPGPPEEPDSLYCKFDGWQYPRDYDVNTMAGM